MKPRDQVHHSQTGRIAFASRKISVKYQCIVCSGIELPWVVSRIVSGSMLKNSQRFGILWLNVVHGLGKVARPAVARCVFGAQFADMFESSHQDQPVSR